MIKTNQSVIIAKKLDDCLNEGMDDKQKIYTKIVDELGVPRPTVRRVARDFKTSLENKIKILEQEIANKKYKNKKEDKPTVGY